MAAGVHACHERLTRAGGVYRRRMAADEQLIRDVEGTLEAVAAALAALQARRQTR